MSLIYSNIPELEGTETEIALTNLSHLEEELEHLLEKRIAHLCELARAVIKDGGDVDLVKSIILSIRSDGEIDSDRICHDNLCEMRELFSKISLIERLIIFKSLISEMPMQSEHNLKGIRNISEDAKNRIAYMKNSYNDMAFVRLSERLENPKAFYLGNTTEVCESVLSGTCQFCILPVETMRDGRLISFYEAIMNYDLRICAEFDLKNPDSAGYTRYALLGDGSAQIGRLDDGDFIEISYPDDNVSFNEILLAAEYLGLRLDSIDTFAINGISEKKRYCAVFSTNKADVEAFITYLSIDCPDVQIMGFYRRI